MKRRDFLLASGATLAAASFGSLYFLKSSALRKDNTTRGFLFGEGVREHPANAALGPRSRRASKPGSFTLLDSTGAVAQRWSTPFFPHMVRQNPWRPQQIVGVQKWGSHLALLDLRAPEGLRFFNAEDHFDYFGHAAFLDNGRIMAVSAHNWKTNLGEIHLYNCDNFELMNILPSFGSSPHDIQVDSKNPDILVIANSGAYVAGISTVDAFGGSDHVPKMSWVDWRQKKLLKELPTQDPENFLPIHFGQADDDRVFIYGNSSKKKESPSLAVFEKKSETLKILTSRFAPNYEGECLNMFLDYRNSRLWVAVPGGNNLVVLDSNTYRKILDIPAGSPRSLTHISDDVLFVSTVEDGHDVQAAFELSSMRKLNLEDLHKKVGAQFILAEAYGIHTMPYIKPSV